VSVPADGASTFRVPPTAYDRHIGRYGRALAEALAGAAGVRPPQRALDVGCGPGVLTGVLAERLGAGRVGAVDPSEPFVEACRARFAGADVRLGAAERLPFGDGEFDCVLSQLVVNFMTDAELGVREMRRVARPGGVVASAVWDYAGEMTLLRAFWDAAGAVDPQGAAAHDEGLVMRWCREEELAALWRSAGLLDVASGALVVEAAYESFDDLWTPFTSGVAPSGAYCVSLAPATLEALRAEMDRRLGSPVGPFRLTARAWFATGRVPG
jgi:SAM-dependent methyltransferase